MTPKWMHLPALTVAMFGLLCTSAAAQVQAVDSSPEATSERLEAELAQLREQMLTRYKQATPEERTALPDLNLWPVEQILPKVAQAAERFAGSPDAVPFHLWIVRDSWRLPNPAFALQSIDQLLVDHAEDERLDELADRMPRFAHHLGVEGTLERLDLLHKSNARIDVQAACMLARARVKPGSQDDLKNQLRAVIAFAPDTASGHRARGQLFEVEHLQVGCQAPEIRGTTLEGQPFKLSDYRGKVVVLEFWSVHCGPCRQKTPDTAARIEKYAGLPFAHIGIHSDGIPESVIRESIEELGVTWPTVLDLPEDGSRMGPVASLWQVNGWPTVYVIDHQGVIRSNWAREQAMRELVPALIEQAQE